MFNSDVISNSDEIIGYVYGIRRAIRMADDDYFAEMSKMLIDILKDYDDDDLVKCTWQDMGAWHIARLIEA